MAQFDPPRPPSRFVATPGMFRLLLALLLVGAIACGDDVLANEPPFFGTAFISPDIITASDPTSLRGVEYVGRGRRRVYDRRVGAWETVEVFLFDVEYAGQPAVEYQVNLEFETRAAARAQVDVYAPEVGRLPAVLLSRLIDVEIHAGKGVFGGNRIGTIHIHTEQGASYARGGFLEEVLFHEGVHVSLEADHENAPGWRSAQAADGQFISTYARDHPTREDLAESILAYFAVRIRPGSLSPSDRAAILSTIPHRLDYLDRQRFDWSPFGTPVPALPAAGVAMLVALLLWLPVIRRWRAR